MDSDVDIKQMLEAVESIAVLGIKDGPADAAFRVPAYLQKHGYRILPVNPKLESVLGEPIAPSLADLGAPADLIDVFRAAAHLDRHVEEILALSPRPRAVWFQEGIRHDEVAARLEAAGIAVVQDRCLMVEHGRLFGAPVPGHAS